MNKQIKISAVRSFGLREAGFDNNFLSQTCNFSPRNVLLEDVKRREIVWAIAFSFARGISLSQHKLLSVRSHQEGLIRGVSDVAFINRQNHNVSYALEFKEVFSFVPNIISQRIKKVDNDFKKSVINIDKRFLIIVTKDNLVEKQVKSLVSSLKSDNIISHELKIFVVNRDFANKMVYKVFTDYKRLNLIVDHVFFDYEGDVMVKNVLNSFVNSSDISRERKILLLRQIKYDIYKYHYHTPLSHFLEKISKFLGF